METWKSLDVYGVEVSDQGRIRFTETQAEIHPHKYGKGYRRVMLNGESWPVHRLVLFAFVGPCPEGHEVNHINNVRDDNRIENLEYVTSSQNTLHAVKTGTWPIGERRWNSKLNDDVVRTMRLLYGQGWTIRQVSDHFKANFTTTYHVLMGHNWRHVL